MGTHGRSDARIQPAGRARRITEDADATGSDRRINLAVSTDPAALAALTPSDVLGLQRAIGNSAVQRLVRTDLRSAPVPTVQRQAKPADPNRNDCADLLAQILEAMHTLIQRASDLINDPLGLQWDNWNTPRPGVGSVVGHQQQYEGWRNRLRRLIGEWDDDDCNQTGLRIPQAARDLQFQLAPSPTPRPRPTTPAPRPWESPGAHRIGAAARGAAIGATAGLVLGGIIGAIGGGAGGTLVAPGVGTVGGGYGGAVAGASAGAVAGAEIGSVAGGLIGWLTN